LTRTERFDDAIRIANKIESRYYRGKALVVIANIIEKRRISDSYLSKWISMIKDLIEEDDEDKAFTLYNIYFDINELINKIENIERYLNLKIKVYNYDLNSLFNHIYDKIIEHNYYFKFINSLIDSIRS